MPKPASKPIIGESYAGRLNPPRWQETAGTFIAGTAEIDGLDALAMAMERKWGCDRLRLLVPTELREKFDRQRYLTNQAIWHGDLEAVRQQTRRMQTAWRALDKAAADTHGEPVAPEVWEVVLGDGVVAAIVREEWQARLVSAQGRYVRVYALGEVARLLAGFPALAAAKVIFPGATVTSVRTHIGDPLDAIPDAQGDFDDAIPF